MVVAESVDDHGDQGAGLVGQRDVVGTDVVADDVPVAHRGAQFLQLSAESLIKSMLHDMAFERSDFTGHACLGDNDRGAPVDLAVADEGREVVAEISTLVELDQGAALTGILIAANQPSEEPVWFESEEVLQGLLFRDLQDILLSTILVRAFQGIAPTSRQMRRVPVNVVNVRFPSNPMGCLEVVRTNGVVGFLFRHGMRYASSKGRFAVLLPGGTPESRGNSGLVGEGRFNVEG